MNLFTKNLAHYGKKIAAWLLPYSCILCSKQTVEERDLCQACAYALPCYPTSCPCCARLLSTQAICGQCLTQPPAFTRTFALYLYEPPVTKIITQLKFAEKLGNARLLGEMLTQKIQHEWYKTRPLPDMIIPLPLHPKRLQERGFNQAIEIARPIAKKLRLPLALTACQRIKHTAAQATLPAKERLKNVVNAFVVSEALPRHVAVVDDVITTGHTMAEFCRVLKAAGVEMIDVWCCARPVL